MQISEIGVSTANEWVDPVLEIDLKIEHKQDRLPLLQGGKLRVRGKSLSELSFEADYFEAVFMASSSYQEVSDKTQQITAFAPLSDQAINYIEDIRKRDEKGGFKLDIQINGLDMRSELYIASLHKTENTIEFDEGRREGFLMAYDSDANIHPGRRDNWFLSAWDAGVFYTRQLTLEENIQISGADWTHDFLPVFTDTQLKTVSYDIDFGVLPDELRRAWGHLEDAESKLANHEDRGAIASCREAFHSVKSLDDLYKEEVGETKWGKVMDSAKSVVHFGLHTEEIGEDVTLTDVELVLNTIRGFVAYASRNYPDSDND